MYVIVRAREVRQPKESRLNIRPDSLSVDLNLRVGSVTDKPTNSFVTLLYSNRGSFDLTFDYILVYNCNYRISIM